MGICDNTLDAMAHVRCIHFVNRMALQLVKVALNLFRMLADIHGAEMLVHICDGTRDVVLCKVPDPSAVKRAFRPHLVQIVADMHFVHRLRAIGLPGAVPFWNPV
jgi:hypothetical protein